MQVDPEELFFAVEYSTYFCVTKSLTKLRYGPSNTKRCHVIKHINRVVNLLTKAKNGAALVYKTAGKSYILGLLI